MILFSHYCVKKPLSEREQSFSERIGSYSIVLPVRTLDKKAQSKSVDSEKIVKSR